MACRVVVSITPPGSEPYDMYVDAEKGTVHDSAP
jgi:hypothetical protein